MMRSVIGAGDVVVKAALEARGSGTPREVAGAMMHGWRRLLMLTDATGAAIGLCTVMPVASIILEERE
jgi:hypothetical protein